MSVDTVLIRSRDASRCEVEEEEEGNGYSKTPMLNNSTLKCN